MDESNRKSALPQPMAGALAGLPDWITPDWIKETMRVWQPHYEQELTTEDAVEIILGWHRMIQVLREEPKQ